MSNRSQHSHNPSNIFYQDFESKFKPVEDLAAGLQQSANRTRQSMKSRLEEFKEFRADLNKDCQTINNEIQKVKKKIASKLYNRQTTEGFLGQSECAYTDHLNFQPDQLEQVFQIDLKDMESKQRKFERQIKEVHKKVTNLIKKVQADVDSILPKSEEMQNQELDKISQSVEEIRREFPDNQNADMQSGEPAQNQEGQQADKALTYRSYASCVNKQSEEILVTETESCVIDTNVAQGQANLDQKNRDNMSEKPQMFKKTRCMFAVNRTTSHYHSAQKSPILSSKKCQRCGKTPPYPNENFCDHSKYLY